jgi:hypothetical protein
MTLEELQAMTERELDALVAEKVMGWEGVAFYPAVDDHEGGYFLAEGDREPEAGMQPGKRYEHTSKRGRTYVNCDFVSHYSTDLNLAAQVEEKVIEKVGDVRLMEALAQTTDALRFVTTDALVSVMFRATARERVIACLLAWEGE